jgi:hypothetical protein
MTYVSQVRRTGHRVWIQFSHGFDIKKHLTNGASRTDSPVRTLVKSGCVALLVVSGLIIAAGRVGADGVVTGFVAMSGQVTDSLGNPDTGVTVSFASYTTVTDANGDYLFPYVAVNTSGGLSFSGGSAVTSTGIAESADVGTNGNGSFFVGTQDVTENLVWPAQTEVDVTALDSNGNPLVGFTMSDGGGNGLFETLSDGSTVVDFFQTPVQGNPAPPGATCVTDASGVCSLPAMEGNYELFIGGSAYEPFPGSVPVNASGGVFVTTDPTPLTLQYGPGSLPVTVNLSGQVTDSIGNPDMGVTVSFDNYTAVTDANGDYLMTVPPNTSGALSFSGGSAVTSAGITESADVGANGNGSFTVGAQDVTENLVWPAQTEVDVTTLDSNSNPIAGITVTDGGGNGLSGTLSDGSTVVDFFQTPVQGNPAPPGATCVTDASGVCSLPAMEGNYELFIGGSAYEPFAGSVPVGANGGVFVITDPTLLTLQYGPGSLAALPVNLSGQVTDSIGNPDTGVTVSFDNYTTVTDANGDYLMTVPANTSGALSFSGGSAVTSVGMTESAEIGENGQSGFTVGTQDVTENLVWPAQTEVDVTALDSNGTPIAGVTVSDGGGNGLLETLSDGSTVVDFFQTPVNPIPPAATCVTDASGEWSLPAMVGPFVFFYSAFAPFPNVPDFPVLGSSCGVFTTAAPSPCTITYSNFAAVQSAGTISGSVAASTPAGTSISGMSNASIGNALPSGATVLTGALSYTVTGVPVGGTISVTLQLPPGSDPTNVFKYQNGAYVDVTSIATISGDTVTLLLTDGGLGDADGVANGVIVDPVILVQDVLPGAPTLETATGSDSSASVTFAAPLQDGGSPILGYTATCKSSNGGATESASGSASPISVTGLTPGSSYTCAVTAQTLLGSGASSNTSSSFTTLIPQTINFTPPASGSVGHWIALSATGGTSGNSVVFSLDASSGTGVCKIFGSNTLYFITVGTCVIDANQAGNSTYAAATTIARSITVKASQAIFFGSLSNKTMVQSPVTASATATSGLTVAFNTTTPTVCTSSGNNGATITLLAAGLCTVQASQAGNATYNAATPVSRTFTVSKASQTISFGALASKTLAQSPLTVTATATSGLTVAFITTTPTVCSSGGTNGATITLLKAGSCTVQASQAGNATYNPATAVGRSFTVSRR